MKNFNILFFLLSIICLSQSCGSDDEGKKITCVKTKTSGEFHKLSWEKIGDLEALYDQRFEKEIMGKQFGEQHFYTLAVKVKNTSCFAANFTINFELVTFSSGALHNQKSKKLEAGEEAEFKSLPFAVKGNDDLSDKDFSVTTDFIAKKTKITYEKKFTESEKTCHCEPTDEPENSPIMKVVKEEALNCQSDVDAVKEGQIGGTVTSKASEKKSNSNSKSSDDCEQALSSPKTATVATESDNLMIRARPSSQGDVVIKAPKGASVSITCYGKNTESNGKKGRWAKVIYAGKEGWAWENFLTY